MAKLKRVLETAEHAALSAALRELYSQKGDKFVLDADDAEGLQQSLDAERARAKALETKLAGFGDLSPEQVKKSQEDAAKAQREKDLASGNFDKILAENAAKHAKDLELRDAVETRLRGSLSKALIKSEAIREITAQGGSIDLLLPIIEARSKLQTVGDEEVAVIIGEKGGPRLKANAKTAEEFMPMSEFVAELKGDKKFAGAFAAGVGSGSGGQRNGQQQRTPMGPAKAQAETANRIAQQIAGGANRLTE
jgi:hypothetical protein